MPASGYLTTPSQRPRNKNAFTINRRPLARTTGMAALRHAMYLHGAARTIKHPWCCLGARRAAATRCSKATSTFPYQSLLWVTRCVGLVWPQVSAHRALGAPARAAPRPIDGSARCLSSFPAVRPKRIHWDGHALSGVMASQSKCVCVCVRRRSCSSAVQQHYCRARLTTTTHVKTSGVDLCMPVFWHTLVGRSSHCMWHNEDKRACMRECMNETSI